MHRQKLTADPSPLTILDSCYYIPPAVRYEEEDESESADDDSSGAECLKHTLHLHPDGISSKME